MSEAYPAIQILLFLGVWEVIKYLINAFMKKQTDPPYVTRSECASCKGNAEQFRAFLTAEMRRVSESLDSMKGILLVVAIHAGVNPEKIKDLTK